MTNYCFRVHFEKCMVILLVSLATNMTGALIAQDVKDAKPGSQVAAKLTAEVTVELDYLLYLPEDYESSDQWPLVLFLHGAGERGSNLERVKVHGPPKLIEGGKSFPFIVASPQCPAGKRWKSIELIGLIDKLCGEYKVDPDRIYVTGLSMGGFGTWELAADYPDRLAAIVPICGGGEPFWAGVIREIPVWAFHGAKDNVIPLNRSEAMIEAIRRAGAEPKLTVYPDAGHDSWTEAYENPELYTWMLEQSRKKADKSAGEGK